MTLATLLAFLPGWVKYYLVPAPLRFVWFFVWLALKRAAYCAHKVIVLQGGPRWAGALGTGSSAGRAAGASCLRSRSSRCCRGGAEYKLDAALAQRSGTVDSSVLRGVALQRLHGRISLWADVRYWWDLAQGRPCLRPALRPLRDDDAAAAEEDGAEQEEDAAASSTAG